LRFGQPKVGGLLPYWQVSIKFGSDVWPAALALADVAFALFSVLYALLFEPVDISLFGAAIRAKIGIVGNFCLAVAAFHKALLYLSQSFRAASSLITPDRVTHGFQLCNTETEFLPRLICVTTSRVRAQVW
jgi:hypothetical protein